MKISKILVSMVCALITAGVLTICAATYDQSSGGSATPAGAQKAVVLVGYADFGEQPAAAQDVYKVITIPTNFCVLNVAYKVTEAETLTATACIGDSSSTNKYSASINISSLGNVVMSTNMNNVYTGGPDYISVTPQAVASNGIIKVEVLGVQL